MQATRSTTERLCCAAGAEVRAFTSLLDECGTRPPATSRGPLSVEWVAPADTEDRCGLTLFEHPTGRGRLWDVARTAVAQLFDAEAERALAALSNEARQQTVSCHLGLAWDRASGYRLKGFITGEGVDDAARVLGLTSTENVIGVGFDVWDGGVYRARHYYLEEAAPADATPPFTAPPGGHLIFSETAVADARGQKSTWSAIFPPHADSDALRAYVDQALPDVPEGYTARPSAFELDRYADGRTETDVLFTVTTDAPA